MDIPKLSVTIITINEEKTGAYGISFDNTSI